MRMTVLMTAIWGGDVPALVADKQLVLDRVWIGAVRLCEGVLSDVRRGAYRRSDWAMVVKVTQQPQHNSATHGFLLRTPPRTVDTV